MRSLAEQSVAEMGGRTSVLARQRADHADLHRLLQRCARATGMERERVLQEIFRLVFPHAFAEEAVLWPAVRRLLPDGEELTLRIEKEHQAVNEIVANLQRCAPDDPRRQSLLERAVEVLDEDVRDEEDLLLPRLQAALPPRRLRRLGWAWLLVRRTSPTRPHPVVSRRPPGQTLSALPLTVLDRGRDRLDRLSWAAPRPLAAVAEAASHLLGRAAAGTEQITLLRSGDRTETHR